MSKNALRDTPGERTYSVSPNFVDNAAGHKYSTIQAAIDAAYSVWGAVTDFSHGIVILVHPGKYTEQIHSYPGYHVQGFTHESSSERKTAVLYNTGLDAAHYPLRGDDSDNYYIEGMNIEVDSGGVVGKIGDDYFTKVNFRYGDFIESTEVDNTYTQFRNCSFLYTGFNLTGVQVTGKHNIQMDDCWLSQYTWVTTSTHNDTCSFYIDNCIFNRSFPNLSGDWNMQILNSHVFGNTKTQIDTSGDLVIIDSLISNGLHFVSDPGTIKILSCGFSDNEGFPITGEDITADVDITGVEYLGNLQQNGISGKIQTTGNVVNVGGDATDRYYSIQDGIDSLPSGGIVSLSPGTYTEQIHSTIDVRIQGRTHEGAPAVKSTILYNTGADAAHYPLGGDDTDKFSISDITIKTDAGATIGKLSASKFTGVVIENGHFIESTANQAMLMGFWDCSFENSMAFNLTGVGSGGMRALTIIGCYFNDHTTHWKLDSTHTNTLAIVKNTMFHNFYPDVGGNWKVEYSNCHSFGTSRSVISTTNRIAYIQSIMSNGLHFTSNPDVIIQLCTFNDDCGYAITGADITTTVDVTGVSYVHNVQQNGLPGTFKYLCPVKPVGCNMTDRYMTVQDAITASTTKATVLLFEDFTGLSELTIPTGLFITIDGQKTYSLAFTNDIVEVNNSSQCVFQSFVELTGGEVLVNGATAKFKFEDCNIVNGHITVTNGSDVKIRRTGIIGDTGFPAITVNGLGCPVTFGYSKLVGATGQAAIKATVDADAMIKGKFSTLVSGTPATVDPILYTGAGKLDIALYNSALSGSFSAATITNTIASPNLTTDAGITY